RERRTESPQPTARLRFAVCVSSSQCSPANLERIPVAHSRQWWSIVQFCSRAARAERRRESTRLHPTLYLSTLSPGVLFDPSAAQRSSSRRDVLPVSRCLRFAVLVQPTAHRQYQSRSVLTYLVSGSCGRFQTASPCRPA